MMAMDEGDESILARLTVETELTAVIILTAWIDDCALAHLICAVV
jgi:hypothetical protein